MDDAGRRAPAPETRRERSAGADGTPARSGLRPSPARAAGRDIAAGLALALVAVAYSLSFGALVFSGPLAALAQAGVIAAALSAGCGCLAFALVSSFPRAVGGPDTPVVAVVAALTAGLAGAGAGMGAGATGAAVDPAQVFADVAAALIAACGVVALALGAVGAWRLAGWLRFVPFPVVTGFLAGSGGFLALAGLSLAAGLDRAALLAGAFDGRVPAPALAAAGVAVALAILRRLTGSTLAAPLCVIAATLAVVAAVGAGALPVEPLRAGGWLPPLPPEGGPALPVMALAARAPDPAALLAAAPEILSVALVAAMALMLNAAGLEAHAHARMDLDREFLASSLASLAAMVVAGLPSNLSLNRSALNVEMGAGGRASAALAGLGCIAFALAGPGAAAYVPMPVLGGMALYMGAGMLRRWLGASAGRMTLFEYGLAVAIFALILRYGYLEGVALGVLVSCVSFALACARAPAVRQRLTRADYASFVDRPAEAETALRAAGGRIRIFRLQGFLFFGVAARVAEEARAAAEAEARAAAGAAPGRSVVLDFHAVTGVDSTARVSLQRLRDQLAEAGVDLIFTGLDPEGRRARALGIDGADAWPTLEQGLEVCEDRLLAALGLAAAPEPDILAWLEAELAALPAHAPRASAAAPAATAARIVAALRRRDLVPGEVLCRQGEPPDALYFIVRGRVSIFLEPPGGARLRLRSALGRTVIGEIGFFTGAARSASVVADLATEVRALDAGAFARLKAGDPAAAMALEELVIGILADRLTFANREVAALQ
ncbi:MAG: SulP family inorganic anion transporter [Pseudomonadota bacterium]|nr:SulP family inorganic anion transporter [Pseudomonadota bacterium]